VTGASGFIGQNFLETVKNHFKIFAISRRRPPHNALTDHPNITWIPTDISCKEGMDRAKQKIIDAGGIQYLYHLAGFYDFNYDNNPEYQRTNVVGTRHVLEMAKDLNIERFIFASSLAACVFPGINEVVDESTACNADFEYAKTKREGEKLTKEFSIFFKTSVVRFGAAFSDWCEYGPLYHFIKTWSSKSWKSRMLGGAGESAITYIHVNCLNDLILKIFHKSEELPAYDIYIASPDRPVTHNELFQVTSKYLTGTVPRSFHIPKALAYIGVLCMDFFGKLIGKRPFEKPWMMQYIDKQLCVDASYTRKVLDWQPTRRYRIQRRLLYMVEHMKSYPYEWQKRNLKAAKSLALSPNFKIYQVLEELREPIVEQIRKTFVDEKNRNRFGGYHKIEKTVLRKDILTIYQFLSVAVRSNDRVSVLAYARQIAHLRYQEHFSVKEVVDAFNTTGEIIRKNLSRHTSLKGMETQIYNEISLTFQLMADEVEGTFEFIQREKSAILGYNSSFCNVRIEKDGIGD
jgi:nucleoside-diphosphate-sugar epimerase